MDESFTFQMPLECSDAIVRMNMNYENIEFSSPSIRANVELNSIIISLFLLSFSFPSFHRCCCSRSIKWTSSGKMKNLFPSFLHPWDVELKFARCLFFHLTLIHGMSINGMARKFTVLPFSTRRFYLFDFDFRLTEFSDSLLVCGRIDVSCEIFSLAQSF